MADTFRKKSLQQKKAKKKLDKLERREERKTNNNKGKSMEEMTVYLDENGNLTDVHPDLQVANPIKRNHNHVERSKDTTVFTGTVALFFDDKGYGFITDDLSKTNIFLHQNNLKSSVVPKDRVSYKKEKTSKGFAAYDVVKL